MQGSCVSAPTVVDEGGGLQCLVPALWLCGGHAIWFLEKDRIFKFGSLCKSKFCWLYDDVSMIQDGDYSVLVPVCILSLFARETLVGSENGFQIDLEDLDAKLPGPFCRVPQFRKLM